jgi:hypothetical protein
MNRFHLVFQILSISFIELKGNLKILFIRAVSETLNKNNGCWFL